jgi:ankyrin repeat protein
MQIPWNRLSVLSGVVLLLMSVATRVDAGVYKCSAADGTTTYSDQPCAPNAQTVQVTPAPLHSAPTFGPKAPGPGQSGERAQRDAPLTPATIAAAQEKSARETRATLCASRAFNTWIRVQARPLPDPNIRVAKMIEFSNQCRRPLGLSDMIPPAPIVAAKAILKGPAGDAAAIRLADWVKSGSIQQLQRYLSMPGININDRPGTDKALLDYAAEQNQVPVARFLLAHGALINATAHEGPDAGYTALHRAAISDAAEVAQLLLASGADVNVHGPLGITPLILAATHGSRRAAEVLLDHGADVFTADGHRETALSEATTRNHPDIVRLILMHAPTPTSTNFNSMAMRGDVDTLSILIRHDELVHDIPTTLKNEALRYTILGSGRFEDRKQIIELLLADGVDIDNHQPGEDIIPLMLAQTPQMVQFLFEHGANQKAKVSGPRLAQQWVCNNRGKDPKGTLEIVVAQGIDIKGSAPRGSSALSCAERSNNPDLVAFLRAQGVEEGGPKNTAPPSTAAVAQAPQFFPRRPCVELDRIVNRATPIELYGSLNDCVQNNRDADAIGLFALAGMDSSFDSMRVTDKTAGQARDILIMALFGGMAADAHARFDASMKDFMKNPQRHAALCEQIKKIGPPQYFPGYMVNHGMGVMQSALSNQAPPAPLGTNFDAATAWTGLTTTYLNCDEVAAKPSGQH